MVRGEGDQGGLVAVPLTRELPEVQLAATAHLRRPRVAQVRVVRPDDDLRAPPDLPIEVRVELGAISLPAAEWAQLQPGDAIPLGPKRSPIRLRANGVVIAEGELVRVDDQLGVRITSLSSSKAT